MDAVKERIIYTAVSYLSVGLSLNLALYCLVNNFQFDCGV